MSPVPTRPPPNSTFYTFTNRVRFPLSNLGEVPKAEGGKPLDDALDDLEKALEKIIEEIG